MISAPNRRPGRASAALAALVLIAVAGTAGGALAQDAHRHGQMHGTEAAPVEAAPVEAGQSAFAAMAEIVAILQADPATDWDKVDLAALRQHLVDMDDLMLRSTAVAEQVPGGLRLRISGPGATGAAIRRMVPAHAVELAKQPGWQAKAEIAGPDAILLVTADAPDQVARIRGLGFFGLMATGAHHQAHHLAIARGAHMHGH